MSSRPLHAVLLPPGPDGGPFLSALAAALDGTGPAILPLDPGLPPARLRKLVDAFAPTVLETPEGSQRGISPSQTLPEGLTHGVDADTAVVIATSGSTGQPKGVQLTASALRASAASSLARIGARPGERWLCCLPVFHVAGIQVLVRSLVAGTDPVVTDRVDAGLVSGSGCAHVSLVPTQLRRLLDAPAPIAAFRSILLGGAAPGGSLLDDARGAGARVLVTYGMSETSGGCVYDGWPLDGVRVRLGEGGRIEIAGPVLFSGYRPATARGPVAPDGWFRTSDLGHLDAAGCLTVRGRADDVINTGGEKVVPGEVEAALGTIPGVADVVVIGVPDSEWGELVTAVVVPADPAAPPDLARLRAQARGSLPGYAVPRRLLLAARIPLLASGKPDRVAVHRSAVAAIAQQDPAE